MQLNRRSLFRFLCVFLLNFLAGCEQRGESSSHPAIAVTNTYLQCAVLDVAGGDADVVVLSPPGMCPGHFDISPQQVSSLSNCRLLIRADFQERIEDSLGRMKDRGLEVVSVSFADGMCVPDTYIEVCKETIAGLQKYGIDGYAAKPGRLLEISRRLRNLSAEMKEKLSDAGLAEADVLCSVHQAAFAKWLGLNVAGTFVGSDMETAGHLQDVLESCADRDIRFVIANMQEGTDLARALSERLDCPIVVFSNFPEIQPGPDNFDALLRSNLQNLLEASGR